MMNTPIRCVAIDDEPLALLVLKEYIARFPQLQLLNVFDDAISGGEFLREHKIDLLFVDINMPDITGLDLVRSLHEKPMIIFTTAHKKFAIEGFELNAIDYLLKPLAVERFSKAIHKAIEYYEYKKIPKEKSQAALFVYSEYRLIKINPDDIVYIESLQDYVRIHLVNDKPILSLMTMKAVLEKLPAEKFKRIHRSYIVSVDKVASILNRKVKLITSAELPVSNSYSSFLNEWQKP